MALPMLTASPAKTNPPMYSMVKIISKDSSDPQYCSVDHNGRTVQAFIPGSVIGARVGSVCEMRIVGNDRVILAVVNPPQNDPYTTGKYTPRRDITGATDAASLQAALATLVDDLKKQGVIA